LFRLAKPITPGALPCVVLDTDELTDELIDELTEEARDEAADELERDEATLDAELAREEAALEDELVVVEPYEHHAEVG
jgi:hypothetical protein